MSKVNESHMRLIPDQRNSVSASRDQHLSSATVQLVFPVTHAERQLELLCVSTIPAFQVPDAGQAAYVDKRYTSVAVEVAVPQKSAAQNSATGLLSWTPGCTMAVLLAVWVSTTSWVRPQ